MKLFVTGISGLLGLNVALQARERYQVSGCYHSHPIALDGVDAAEVDVTATDALEQTLTRVRPDLIVHTAGLTNVEACEDNPLLAYRYNAEAAGNVAALARSLGARLAHVSTDHLFDGTMPWRTEADTPTPLNVYAETKRQAEVLVLQAYPDALLIRTNFFGWGPPIRRSFSDWILQALSAQRELTMFADVFFTPICINDLIDRVLALLMSGTTGICHVAGGERLTKYAFALETARVFGYPTELIRPISVDDFPFRARRPKDMSLRSRRAEDLLEAGMPTVRAGLERLRGLHHAGWHQALEGAIQTEPVSAQPGA